MKRYSLKLDQLFAALARAGYAVKGPRLKDGDIVLGDIASPADLPAGYKDEQSPGRYRLTSGGGEYFGAVNYQPSWKELLFLQRETIWRAQKGAGGFSAEPEKISAPKTAFLGVRPCDMAAIKIQDRVFSGGEYADARYRARRDNVLIIAANCTRACANCFCASMGTGPDAGDGCDIALTETGESFVAQAGSAAGESLLKKCAAASKKQIAQADALVAAARAAITKQLDAKNIKRLLQDNQEHPRWKETGKRCLNCANCTMVCPTCFCSVMEDYTSLDGKQSWRTRRADSCFTMDFSHIHGCGSVRYSAKSRYRQWMTHKLAHWHDQFGSSGCVGCGRCITWCPVGIDITEEAAAIAGKP
ncbi:MAG: 4Fe-4S dicluster domain-containing protein [Elusimicrobiales bacterium]